MATQEERERGFRVVGREDYPTGFRGICPSAECDWEGLVRKSARMAGSDAAWHANDCENVREEA